MVSGRNAGKERLSVTEQADETFMSAEICALLGFFILLGVTAGLYALLHMSSGETLVLAAIMLSLVMHGGAAVGHIRAAAGVYIALGIGGAIVFAMKGKNKQAFFSPAVAAACAIFLGSLFLFRNAFIQNIDDFHQWAAAVKYMLERGHLPGADFLGTASMPAYTGTFHLFFQILGGYHEGNMYVSAMLLNMVPLLLPISRLTWKDWKKAVWYVTAVLLGIYQLYVHPYKSLYVDLPAAAWAAGLGIWWVMQLSEGSTGEEGNGQPVRNILSKPGNVIFLVLMAFFAVETKWGIGILLVGFTVLYMLMALLVRTGRNGCLEFIRRHRRAAGAVLIVFVLAVIAGVLLMRTRWIPVSFAGLREALMVSSDKAQLTLSKLLENIFSRKLHSASRLQLTAVLSTALITLGLLAAASFAKGWHKHLVLWHSAYTIVIFVLYVAALYITYVSTFSYDESTSNAAVHRYLACIALYLFFLMMGMTTVIYRQSRSAAAVLAGIFVLIFFGAGVKSDIIYKASGYQYWKVYAYTSIRDAKKQLQEIDEIAGDAKVYMLNQQPTLKNMDELPTCVALYYREGKISNYLREPWKFMEEGSLKMVHSAEETLDDLPGLLADGEYEYLWIYTTDDYLNENLPDLVDMDGGPEDATLYRVTAAEDGTVGLEKVQAL